MTRLLIGAPVNRREWIIDHWLAHAAESADKAGVDYSFVLLGGIDDPTFDIVRELPAYNVACIYVDEPRNEDIRDWIEPRIHRMVELRNTLLGYVRLDAPDYFLSCDSDVLLHPQTITNLIETQIEREWAAVGGYCYLSEDRGCPSYADFPGDYVLPRPDLYREQQRCEILMAIVLMTEKVWNIDYQFSVHGEDIGHGVAIRNARLPVGVDARIINRHIMERRLLNEFDERCGW